VLKLLLFCVLSVLETFSSCSGFAKEKAWEILCYCKQGIESRTCIWELEW